MCNLKEQLDDFFHKLNILDVYFKNQNNDENVIKIVP